MSQHYGQPLAVTVGNGKLVIEIGIHTLAHAVSYAEWANKWNGRDYLRDFAITDPIQFAKDVAHAMQDEREDGSTPLSDFLDAVSEAALDDGSTGAEYEQQIKTGEFASTETWAKES